MLLDAADTSGGRVTRDQVGRAATHIFVKSDERGHTRQPPPTRTWALSVSGCLFASVRSSFLDALRARVVHTRSSSSSRTVRVSVCAVYVGRAATHRGARRDPPRVLLDETGYARQPPSLHAHGLSRALGVCSRACALPFLTRYARVLCTRAVVLVSHWQG